MIGQSTQNSTGIQARCVLTLIGNTNVAGLSLRLFGNEPFLARHPKVKYRLLPRPDRRMHWVLQAFDTQEGAEKGSICLLARAARNVSRCLQVSGT